MKVSLRGDMGDGFLMQCRQLQEEYSWRTLLCCAHRHDSRCHAPERKAMSQRRDQAYKAWLPGQSAGRACRGSGHGLPLQPLRGYENVSAEWQLWCPSHNLLKLYQHTAGLSSRLRTSSYTDVAPPQTEKMLYNIYWSQIFFGA